MFSRAARLRMRRRFRMRKKQVSTLGEQTEEQLDKHFFRRIDRIVGIRRFLAAWIGLLLVSVIAVVVQTFVLSDYYKSFQPAPGGTYVEATLGEFTNANPLYASSLADKTVAELVFSGLLKYDMHNKLTGDLAATWKADDRGEVYTVRLRDNLQWHDGKPLTAEDVVFTYQMIQNADAQSPLRQSWQGVQVAAVDARTITFTLTNPLASFEHSLTNGIIPKHILKDTAAADLRSVPFNTADPVGSGPFKWGGIEVLDLGPKKRETRVALSKFTSYHLGAPQLDGFTMRVFNDRDALLGSYNRRELSAVAGLSSLPQAISEPHEEHNFPQTAAMMTFFRTGEGVLKDKTVRQSLVQATDVAQVKRQLSYPAPSVDAPILKGQVGYNKSLTQLSFNPQEAIAKLEKAGWRLPENSQIREKDGVPLEFSLVAEKSNEAQRVTRALQKQWRAIGAEATINLLEGNEFRVAIASHSYDALLRGIAIGPDPDVYVYWHSSQADIGAGGRLNFSEYESKTADDALEAARTRIDPRLRAEKYEPFLKAWRTDAPAIGLYQPRSLYITRGTVYNLHLHPINDSSDRLSNVHEWMIRREKTVVD